MLSFQSWFTCVSGTTEIFNCPPVVGDCSFYISRCVVVFFFLCVFLFVWFKPISWLCWFLFVCGFFFVAGWVFLFFTECFHHSVSFAPTHSCKMVPMVTLNVFLRALHCPLTSLPSEEKVLLVRTCHPHCFYNKAKETSLGMYLLNGFSIFFTFIWS